MNNIRVLSSGTKGDGASRSGRKLMGPSNKKVESKGNPVCVLR